MRNSTLPQGCYIASGDNVLKIDPAERLTVYPEDADAMIDDSGIYVVVASVANLLNGRVLLDAAAADSMLTFTTVLPSYRINIMDSLFAGTAETDGGETVQISRYRMVVYSDETHTQVLTRTQIEDLHAEDEVLPAGTCRIAYTGLPESIIVTAEPALRSWIQGELYEDMTLDLHTILPLQLAGAGGSLAVAGRHVLSSERYQRSGCAGAMALSGVPFEEETYITAQVILGSIGSILL